MRKQLQSLSFYLLLFGTTTSQVTGQEKKLKEFSIKQAVEFALNNNANVVNTVIDAEIAKAKRNEIRGMGYPQVSGNFDLKDFFDIPTSLIPAQFFGGTPGEYAPIKFGTKYNATAGLTASQLIFNSDFFIGLKASKTYLSLAEKNIQRSKIETTVAITKAYYSVLVSLERIKLLDINLERVKKLLDDTRVMNANGFVEQIDLDRIQVTYNNLATEKEKIARLVLLTEALLKFQMGMEQSGEIALTDKLTGDPSSEISPDLPKISYSSRIEYSLLEGQKLMNELDLKRNKLSYLPGIFAYGSYSKQAQRNELDIFKKNVPWYPIGIIGASVNLPIFDGFQKQQRIQQAKLNVMKTDNTLKMVGNSIDLEIRSAKTNFDNAIASLTVQKKNMELAQGVTKITRIKYEQGVGSNIEVINAEASFKEAENNYFSALYDFYIAKTDLEKATGTIK